MKLRTRQLMRGLAAERVRLGNTAAKGTPEGGKQRSRAATNLRMLRAFQSKDSRRRRVLHNRIKATGAGRSEARVEARHKAHDPWKLPTRKQLRFK